MPATDLMLATDPTPAADPFTLWWGEMAPPLNRSPDLGNSFSRTESINV
jgi:hypothetical protein